MQYILALLVSQLLDMEYGSLAKLINLGRSGWWVEVAILWFVIDQLELN
jgi:hypothetical protein